MKNKEEQAPRTSMVNGALGFKWAERRRDLAYKPLEPVQGKNRC